MLDNEGLVVGNHVPALDVINPIVIAEGKNKNFKSLTENTEMLLATLTSDMKLPEPLIINHNGKVIKDEKAYLKLLKATSTTINNINRVKATHDLTPSEKRKADSLLTKMMLIQQVTQNHVDNNRRLNVYSKYKVNKKLKKLAKTLRKQGIKQLDKNTIHSEAARRHFKEGKGEGFREHLKQMNATSKTGVDFNESVVEFGPLNKNKYTQEYEMLVKGMLAEKPFTHRVETGADESKKVIITMNNKDYDMDAILKYANFNHLSFNQADEAGYLKMISSDKVVFPAAKPNPLYNPATGENSQPIDMIGKEKIEALDKFFIERDKELVALEQAERLALNIYTTTMFYQDSNAMLRGEFKQNKLNKEGYLRELICSTGMALAAINKAPGEKPINTFRGEKVKKEFAALSQERIEAAKTGGVTIISAFTSTAMEKPSANFAFNNEDIDDNVGIVYNNLVGKDLRGLTAFPHEREFLIPPTQIQWEYHALTKGGHLFSAKPVTTLTGLAPEAMKPQSKVLAAMSDEFLASDNLKVSVAFKNMEAAALKSEALLNAAMAQPPTPEHLQVNDALMDLEAKARQSEALLMAAIPPAQTPKRDHNDNLSDEIKALSAVEKLVAKNQKVLDREEQMNGLPAGLDNKPSNPLMLPRANHELLFVDPSRSTGHMISWHHVGELNKENRPTPQQQIGKRVNDQLTDSKPSKLNRT